MKVRNKKVVYTIIGIVAVLLVAIAITYAYWLITKNQTGENVISSACLDISLTNEENDITLSNQFPLSDEDGASLTPYTFTVTNNCNTSVDYHITLESIGTESEAVIPLAIKAKLDENTPKVLSSYNKKNTTIEGAYEARLLGSGTLAVKDTEGSSATHSLRLWIDENAPISEMKKTFKSKISVTIGQGIEAIQGSTLASLILADAETNNYLYSTTPDFSKATEDGEYGLYSAQDDYGTSYYFRGDVENNYVAFGPEEYEYRSAFVPSNVSLEAIEELVGTEEAPTYKALFESMVFSDEETCKTAPNTDFIGVENLWTECKEPKEITEVNNTNTGFEEEIGMLGFTNEQNCITGAQIWELEIDSCEEKEVKIGMQPIYWRTIRINGDGTIRIIYGGTIYSTYNTDITDAKYVGYTYNDGNGNQVDSTIKDVVDEWYTNNLEDDYGKYIADSIFCNDREIASTDGDTTYYGAYDRIWTNKSPKLTCTNKSDRYTVDNTTKGNGILTKPIGLITVDEVAMAGGTSGKVNSTYYLYSGYEYWTMSPLSFNGIGANMWRVLIDGDFRGVYVDNFGSAIGTRPVINLKANTLFAGSGTIDDPYKIVE